MLRQGSKRKKTNCGCSLISQLICFIFLLIGLSVYLFGFAPDFDSKIGTKQQLSSPGISSLNSPIQLRIGAPAATNMALPVFKTAKDIYETIRELFEEGRRNKHSLLVKLTTQNIFNIPTQSPHNWTCPSSAKELISLPDIVNHSRSEFFRANQKGSWLFYQHLRKAGGTGFCDLAQNNLPRKQTPPYFCMIDNRGSLATPPWNNEEYLMSRMENNDFRITANEWDVYHSYMGRWRGAVLASTFRHPVDRWYSQYRFEHLEHRDGSAADAPRRPFRTWYNNNKGYTMGLNYYVTTFEGTPDPNPPKNKGDFYWSYHKYWGKEITWDMFERSLSNIRAFHIVLVTDWLDFAPPLIDKVLGWKTPPKKVLPHASQGSRDANYKRTPIVEIIGDTDYNFVLEENVFDLLFFQCMQRLFLERLHACDSATPEIE